MTDHDTFMQALAKLGGDRALLGREIKRSDKLVGAIVSGRRRVTPDVARGCHAILQDGYVPSSPPTVQRRRRRPRRPVQRRQAPTKSGLRSVEITAICKATTQRVAQASPHYNRAKWFGWRDGRAALYFEVWAQAVRDFIRPTYCNNGIPLCPASEAAMREEAATWLRTYGRDHIERLGIDADWANEQVFTGRRYYDNARAAA